MSKSLRGILCGVLVAAFMSLAPLAQANHHLIQITEVFLGTGGTQADDAMFVELTTLTTGQHFVSGHQMVFYNADGNVVENVPFTSNPSDASGLQGKILVATTEAESFFGVTADLEFDPAGISREGGQVCFNSDSFDDIDCVSWGNYSGPREEAGRPFNPTEGIPLGASALRNEMGGDFKDAYEVQDDHDNSRQDFFMSSPLPEGGGSPTQTPARIQFTTNTYEVTEADTIVEPMITRTGDVSQTQDITFLTRDGTATETSDYDPATRLLTFNPSSTSKIEEVQVNDDSQFEGPETVKLRLRNPTNGAVLGFAANATLTITDDSDDNRPPKTRITRPAHGESYERDNLRKIKGTADDGPGQVNDVDVALLRNMVNGTCRHFNGTSWQAGSCSAFIYLGAQGTETWSYSIDPLKKSVGTDVKSYTAAALASDEQHNSESVLKVGRNKNTFEVD